MGVAGALKAMREMGFKTFSEFWDESYDETECPKVRMQKISYLTELIGEWTPEQISGRSKENFPNDLIISISHESIDRYIYTQPQASLNKKLTKLVARKKQDVNLLKKT